MTSESGGKSDREIQLDEIIAAHIREVERGNRPNRQEFLARYPEFAADLEEYFQDQSRFDELTRLVKPIGEEIPLAGELAATMDPSGERPESKVDSRDLAGTRVRYFGDYELLEEIARGGMGIVYKARQSTLKRIVALKMILAGQFAGEEDVRRFYAEAKAASSLDHPNIVPLFEIGQHEGQHYFSMAYVAGQSLARKIVDGPLPPPEAAKMMKKIADAVAYAHIEGVIHRDLKPANVLLDQVGEPRVTDFGLAKLAFGGDAESLTGLTGTGQVLGTPGYMPPEQAAGRTDQIGPLADVYSLGAMFYCLLTGRPPFQAASPIDTLMQVIEQDPVPLRRLDRKIPRDLETICLKCLEKEPTRRYESTQKLSDDIGRFLDNRPILAQRIGPIGRSARWAQRNSSKIISAATAAMTVVVALVAIFAGVQYYRQSQLASVGFVASGQNLTGEILDQHDNVLVSEFALPTSRNIEVDAGDNYQLRRVASSGVLSETWLMDLHRGSDAFHINVPPEFLWPPKELGTTGRHQYQVVQTSAGPQVLILEVLDSKSSTTRKLRLVDGGTGESAWPTDLIFDKESLPAGQVLRDWTGFWAKPLKSSINEIEMVSPPSDLNADGVDDFVFVSESSPSLIAVSGVDGQILWWFRAVPSSLLEKEGPIKIRGSVIGRATVADVNADGVSDFIACFLSLPSEAAESDASSWIEAVSGKNGESLWRHPLTTRFDMVLNSSTARDKFHAAVKPHVVEIDGQPTVVTIVENWLVQTTLDSGHAVGPPQDIGFVPAHLPGYIDTDADGLDDAVVTLQVIQEDQDQEDDTDVNMQVHSLRDGKTLWNRSLGLGGLVSRVPDTGRWFQTRDIDGDGREEVIVLNGLGELNLFGGSGGWMNRRLRWSGLEVLDGNTGKTRWTRQLRFVDLPQALQFEFGPDINGDGTDEIFVAGVSHPGGDSRLSVVAVSALDGSMLWQWERPAIARSPEDFKKITWWQPGPDGWPVLVVPMAKAEGGQHMTYVVSSQTGRLVQVLLDVFEAEVADFNSDGILDLFYTVSPQGANRMMVVPGRPGTLWKKLGVGRTIEDFNDDGVIDIGVRTGSDDAVLISSGLDGKLLWRHKTENYDYDEHLTKLPIGDVNGDGVADLLTATRDVSQLSVHSGTDGKTIWKQSSDRTGGNRGGVNVLGQRYQYPMIHVDNVNQVGPPLIRVTNVYTPNRFATAVYSVADGRRLFEIPTIKGFGTKIVTGNPSSQDVNGDGVSDLVVWVPDEVGKPDSIQAFGGDDGVPLWGSPAKLKAFQVLWPEPSVGDCNGDGRPEIVSAFTQLNKDNHREQMLVTLDGGDGSLLWQFSWDGTWSEMLPPLLVDFQGNGQRSVCLGIRDQSDFQLVIFDADGVETGRWMIGEANEYDLRQRLNCWNKADLNGDGSEELIFVSDGKLCANQGGKDQFIWQWELPNQKTSILKILNQEEAFRSADDQLATLAVWSGTTVYGLSGSTGQTLWRCPAPAFCNDPHQVEIMVVNDWRTPPRIFFAERGECRQALPVTPTGQYVALRPKPIDYRALAEFEPPRRDMPWRPHPNYRNNIGTVVWFEFIRPLIALTVIILPVLLFYRALRNRKWIFTMWAALYTLITGTSYILFAIYVEGPGDLEALAGLPTALAVTAFALVTARGNRPWIACFLISTFTVTLVLGTGWLILDSFVKPEWQTYSWNGWLWLVSEGVSATGVLILFAFPICVVVYLRRARRRHRQRQSNLLVT